MYIYYFTQSASCNILDNAVLKENFKITTKHMVIGFFNSIGASKTPTNFCFQPLTIAVRPLIFDVCGSPEYASEKESHV